MSKADELMNNLIEEVNNRVNSMELINNYLEKLNPKDRAIVEKKLSKKNITTARQLLKNPMLEYVARKNRELEQRLGKKDETHPPVPPVPSLIMRSTGKPVELGEFKTDDELKAQWKASTNALIEESRKYQEGK